MAHQVENDITLKQMEQLDFRSVKVTVILEDDDETESLPKEVENHQSATKISNEEKNSCVPNIDQIDILVTNNQIKKENKTPYDNNVDLSEFLQYKKTEQNTSAPDSKSNLKENASTKSVNENSRREESSSYKNADDKIKEDYTTTSDSRETQPSVVNDNDKSRKNIDTETSHLKSLLETVADNLISIVEAYHYHIRVKMENGSDQRMIESSLAVYLKIKRHFFNLSYCTVSILILPEENNEKFQLQFLQDVVKRAHSKRGINMPYRLLHDLYSEMIMWSKAKPGYITNLTSRLESTNALNINNGNNNILKEHLKKPPLLFTNTKNQNNRNNTAGVFTHNKNHAHNTVASSLEVTQKLPPPPPYDSYTSASQYNPTQCDVYNTNSLDNNTFRPTSTVNNTTNPITEMSNTLNTNNTNATHQPCIYAAGPPGRQLSISVDQSVLNNSQNNSNFNYAYSNFIATREPNIRNRKINHNHNSGHDVRTQPYQRAPVSSQQMHFPPSQRGHVVHHNRVEPIPNYTVPMQPTYSSPPWQSRIYSQQNMSGNQAQPLHSQLNMSSNQAQPLHSQLNMTSNQAQPLQNVQPDSQNVPEVTRSLSTDSGFTSPLNFNNSTEEMENSNKEEAQSGILITHVTSLNPSASFIKADLCHVCGTSTSTMCLGCYKTYYCSAECQKIDWYLHQNQCKKS